MEKTMTPSNKPMTARQIDKAVSHYRVMLEKHRDEIGSSTAVQQMLGSKSYLAEQLAVVRKHVTAQNVLKFIGTIEIELPFDLNPAEYYRDEPGRLYVYGGFNRGGNIVAAARELPAGTKFRLRVHEISAENGATDEQIEAALGEGHLFDATTLCGMYAAMIAAQSKGEAGDLLNNGYANLAYTSTVVANVYRYTNGRCWLAFTWKRGGGRWNRGDRVFSPAT